MVAGLKLQYGTDVFDVTGFTYDRHTPQQLIKLVEYVGMNPERPHQCAYLPLDQCTADSVHTSFKLVHNDHPVTAVRREPPNHYRIFTANHPQGTVVNTNPPILVLQPHVLQQLIANLHAVGQQVALAPSQEEYRGG